MIFSSHPDIVPLLPLAPSEESGVEQAWKFHSLCLKLGAWCWSTQKRVAIWNIWSYPFSWLGSHVIGRLQNKRSSQGPEQPKLVLNLALLWIQQLFSRHPFHPKLFCDSLLFWLWYPVVRVSPVMIYLSTSLRYSRALNFSWPLPPFLNGP